MTIGKCRECAKEVSDEAKICPHCGIKNPIKKTKLLTKIIAVFIGLAVINSILTSIASKENDETIEKPKNLSEKQLSIKDITTGVLISSIDSLKNKKPKITKPTYSYYDIEYFGEKTGVMIKFDINNIIYEASITLNDPLEKIKPAIEDKISKENNKTVNFSCKKSQIQPDSSAILTTEECTITHSSQILKITQTEIQPTKLVYGGKQIPTYSRSITIIDTNIMAAEEKRKRDEKNNHQKTIDDKKKSDI